MWLTFCPNGALEFSGGFLFYNPASWSYDSENRELRITLGGDKPLGSSFDYQLKHRSQTLHAMDRASRTLVFPLYASSDRIDFGGYVFFRESDSRAARGLTRRCS